MAYCNTIIHVRGPHPTTYILHLAHLLLLALPVELLALDGVREICANRKMEGSGKRDIRTFY